MAPAIIKLNHRLKDPEAVKPKLAPLPVNCGKCGGRGRGPWMPDGGVCYRCGGSGKALRKFYAFPQSWSDNQIIEWGTTHNNKLVAKKKVRDEKKVAAKAACEAQSRQTNLVRLGDLMTKPSNNSFIKDVQLKAQTILLSDKQINAVLNAFSREDLWAAKKAEEAKGAVVVPEGRSTITGEIVSLKEVESMWGITMKMLVRVVNDSGTFKIWGSRPASLYEAVKGDVITMTATLTHKELGFGFFARPSKATKVIKEAV